MRHFFAVNWWSEPSRRTTAYILLLLSIIMLVAIVSSAHGVRGTDQYWYLADVDTLIQGGKPLSNLYFPRALIDGREDSNYFIHNGPALYLSAMFGAWIGAFNGWLIVNLLCHFITAFCIYVAALRHTSRSVATASCFLYFISPIAVWQSVNMMQEHFFAALLAIILAGYTYRDNRLANLSMHLTLVLSVAMHPLFTVLSVVYATVVLFNAIRINSYALLLQSIIFTAICAFIYKIHPIVFPSTFQPDLYSSVAGSIPRISNMVWHYSDTLPSIDAPLLIYKLNHALKMHVSQPYFYFYTNIALLCSAYLLARRQQSIGKMVYLLSLVMALYAALSILMQSQPRYQQIFAPATFLLIALILYDIKNRVPSTIRNSSFTILASVSMSVSLFLCFTVNIQAKNEQQSITELSENLKTIPITSNILLHDSKHETKLSYVLKPRKVLSVKSNLLGSASYAETLSKFKPDFVISTRPLPEFGHATTFSTKLETSHLGDFYIYQASNSLTLTSHASHVALSPVNFNQHLQQ